MLVARRTLGRVGIGAPPLYPDEPLIGACTKEVQGVKCGGPCGPCPGDATYTPSRREPYRFPLWFRLASYAGAATGAYHGYKRHGGSIGWAIGWAVCGSLFPVVTIPLSLAEGYGKPKGR